MLVLSHQHIPTSISSEHLRKKPAHQQWKAPKSNKNKIEHRKQTHPVSERNPSYTYLCQPLVAGANPLLLSLLGKERFVKSRKLNQNENLKTTPKFPPQWPEALAVSSSTRDGSFPPPNCRHSCLCRSIKRWALCDGTVLADATCTGRAQGNTDPPVGSGAAQSACVDGSKSVWPPLSCLLQRSFLCCHLL